MKKGFTLVELIVTILIVALLGAIATISVTSFFSNSNEKYYKTLESNLLLAGNDYFLDHRNELPTKGYTNSVEITTLVEGKYIEPLKKSNGDACTEGKVYVYREKDKYQYEACIECDENYTSSGENCSGKNQNEIVVSAKKATSNDSYDVSLNYDSVEYSKENIIANISIKNPSINVVEYKIINTKTKVEIPCSKMENNICEAEIDVSGTYEIIARLNEAEMLTKYINVKIAKGTPSFTIEKGTITPLTCKDGDTSREINIKIVKNNINEEYKNIEYRIYQKELNEITGEQDRTLVKIGTETNLTRGSNGKEYYIKDSLGSGRYELEVSVANFAGEELTNDVPVEFDVSYLANVVYSDNDYTGVSNSHEVVYKQKYDYKSTLPTSKVKNNNEIDILWTRNNESINGDSKVVDTCTHTIVGTLAREVVQIVDFAKVYCADVTYNGSEQDLAPTHPANVTFKNRMQTNVTHPKLAASIDDSQYIWSDGTTEDIEFECPMKQLACNAPTKVAINSEGKVTWTASSNCKSSQHQVKIGTGTYANAVSGVNKRSEIITDKGTRTAYVKALAPNENYADSPAASGTTTVYTVTLGKESGISSVSGAGKYITGSTVTLGATVSSGYDWSRWKYTDDTNTFSSIKSYSFTINQNWNLTARGKKKITYKESHYYCASGNYTAGKAQYVKTCTAVPKEKADANNASTYTKCTPITSESCPNSTMQYIGQCYKKVVYTRSSCATWDKPYFVGTGLESCGAAPTTTAYIKITCEKE